MLARKSILSFVVVDWKWMEMMELLSNHSCRNVIPKFKSKCVLRLNKYCNAKATGSVYALLDFISTAVLRSARQNRV